MNCIRCGEELPDDQFCEHCAKEKRRHDILTLADQLEREGELEFDESAVVSEGDDNGAYVQAWVWVSFEGTHLDKVKEKK